MSTAAVVVVHYVGSEPLSLKLRPKAASETKALDALRVLTAFCKRYAAKFPESREATPWLGEPRCLALSWDQAGDRRVGRDVDLWAAQGELYVVRAPAVADGLRRACYVGGSITEQKWGWRPRFHEWLEGRVGRKIEAIDAFCGNAGSRLLAFTVRDWVLKRSPDVVFVEVAINDGDALLEAEGEERDVARAVEGMIRTIRAELPATLLVFVEMFLRDDLTKERRSGTRAWVDADDASAAAEVYHRGVVELHSRIAKHYGAALVDLVPCFASMSTHTRDVHFRDDCHHTERGAAFVAGRVADAVAPLLGEPAGPRELPPPLDARFWRPLGAQRFEPQRLSLGPLAAHRAVADRCPVAGVPADWLWLHPGDAINCVFRGRALALLTYVGPDSGRVLVSVDDAPAVSVDLVDTWCYYWRLSIAQLWAGSFGDHVARLRVDPAQPDRRRLKKPIVDANYLENDAFGRTPKLWLRWFLVLG